MIMGCGALPSKSNSGGKDEPSTRGLRRLPEVGIRVPGDPRARCAKAFRRLHVGARDLRRRNLMTPLAKRPIRWILAIMGTLIGLVGIFVVQTIHRSRLILREHHHSASIVLETFPPEVARRPAIFEPEEEGNAWDLEELFLRECDSYNPKTSDMSDGNRLLLARGA